MGFTPMILATFAAAAEGRKLLSADFTVDLSASHGGSKTKQNEMIKKQRHARPWYDFSRYTAHETPDVPDDDPKAQLLVLSDYMTKQGEYLGGNIPMLVYDGPEKETSVCEQYYTINEATGERLTADPGPGIVSTKLFCAAWTADEVSHDETESGHCICKSVSPESDPQYCSSWECVQTEQHQRSSSYGSTSRSAYYSSYSTSRNSYGSYYALNENEYSEFTCTEAWPSGKSCKKWHGVENSYTTVEDERYMCTVAGPDEKFCMEYVGETASTEEAEISTTKCTVVADNGEYCETYVGTETGLSRYRYRIESLLTVFCWGIPVSIACAIWFVGFGLATGSTSSLARCPGKDSGNSTGDQLFACCMALFFTTMFYLLPIGALIGMLVMAFLVGGTVPFLVMAVIHAVLVGIVGAITVAKYRKAKMNGDEFFFNKD